MIHNPPIAKNWAIGLIGERVLPTHADPETYGRHTHPDHIAKHGMAQPPEWGFDELGYNGWESLGHLEERQGEHMRKIFLLLALASLAQPPQELPHPAHVASVPAPAQTIRSERRRKSCDQICDQMGVQNRSSERFRWSEG
jgi:hypothetical protein